jgi:hypothetical protein
MGYSELLLGKFVSDKESSYCIGGRVLWHEQTIPWKSPLSC